MDWLQRIDGWRSFANLKSFPAADRDAISDARERVRDVPEWLVDFWASSNGLSAASFTLLPLEVKSDIKRTWDSFQRANDPASTRFLGQSAELLKRFVVFADVGVGRAGVIDRLDGSIWYEDGDELRQTDLHLDGFIEAILREVSGV